MSSGLLDADRRRRLLGLAPGAAAELEARFDELMRRLGPTQLAAFVDVGLGLAERGPETARAYFALESRRAQDEISRRQRWVLLEENARMLGLFAEALAGFEVVLRPLDEAPEGGRPRGADPRRRPLLLQLQARTDGKTLFLPPIVAEMPDREGNLAILKLAILHQLGLFRCGTFGFELDRLPLARRAGTSADRAEASEGPPPATDFGRFFALHARPELARFLFSLFEGARIDADMLRCYRGVGPDLERVRRHLLAARPPFAELPDAAVPLELLIGWSLGAELEGYDGRGVEVLEERLELGLLLLGPEATVYDSARATTAFHDLLLELVADLELPDVLLPWSYRGRLEPEALQARLRLEELARSARDEAESESGEREAVDGSDGLLEELLSLLDELGATSLQDGDLFALSGLLAEGSEGEDGRPLDLPLEGRELEALQEARHLATELEAWHGPRGVKSGAGAGASVYFYDEWDVEIQDYLRGWCRLEEIGLGEGEWAFVEEAKRRNADLLGRVRRHFELMEPELRRRLHRLIDGEELDLDAAIEATLDRRAGAVLSERVYSRRVKQERDVAAVFLLDLSASTDTEVAPEPAAETADRDEGHEIFPRAAFVGVMPAMEELEEMALWGPAGPSVPRRRVIDVEKEALLLMAEALEGLGDAYAVYGFSGYGREKVEFFVAKEFAERWDERVQRRIAAMRPRQSTRMGTAIRHALTKLDRQEAKVKTLLVLSDGYPQDHDYGRVRGEREHGIQDTMMALREAQLRGIETFCLTVDPAGHDYLRAMCPGERYLVIDDISTLPDELPKVYRALTT